MLLSSETMKSNCFMLGYPLQVWSNNYYTAMPRHGVGVCIAYMLDGFMVQFFPWAEGSDGHEAYANFITAKATTELAEADKLFDTYPFYHSKEDNLLLLKCMVEDGLNKVESSLHDTDRNLQADTTAGETME